MSKKINATSPSYVSYIALILIFGFLFISPFSKGLFNGYSYSFELPIYNTLTVAGVLLLVVSFMLLKKFQLTNNHGVLAIFVWLVAFSYLMSYFDAASMHNATVSFYIQLIHAAFFIAILYVGLDSTRRSALILYGVLGSGFLIVVFGLMNWFGMQPTYKDAVMLEGMGLRLTSVFQYANSYAAYLIGLFVATLSLLTFQKNKIGMFAFSLPLVPILLSLFLTLSRGGYLIFAVVLLLVLPLFQASRQILLGLHTLIAAVAVIAILNPISTIGLDAYAAPSGVLVLKGWAIVIGASLLSSILSLLVQFFIFPKVVAILDKFKLHGFLNYFGFFTIFAVIGIVILTLIMTNSSILRILPESIESRLANINFNQHSVLERGTFYGDAFTVIKDHLLIGSGGGGWSALYQQYQSNPYISRQAHNFLLQYLIETGIIGFLIFFTLFSYIAVRFLIYHYKHGNDEHHLYSLISFIFMEGLILHSIIDFNMSFVYLSTLLFILLAMTALPFAKHKFLHLDHQLNKVSKAYPALMIIVSLVILFVGLQKATAHGEFNRALTDARNQVNFNIVENQLDAAISRSPHHPAYVTQKISFFIQLYKQSNGKQYMNDATSMINSLKEREPYNRDLFLLHEDLLLTTGDVKGALKLTEEYITKFPWDINMYEKLINYHYQLATTNVGNDPSSVQDHKDEINRIVSHIKDKVAYLETLPEAQLTGRPYAVTPTIQQILDQLEETD